ncbi:1-acyl-sn-glycerol-3-phosphate acyltransferase [Methylocapsa sp. S129]|uniref:lysophospholipid acyltransferase family protein n=1 Tax=Methylocapsa sp. S129 TaxID=1641869 RepID=UPI00131C4DA1|nr:lysophospholipid acyltransferase family protein [Methylocapsa sp. S129]
MIVLRVALALSAAALILLFGAPFRWLAVLRGWKTGEGLPVLFHRMLCFALGVRIRVHGKAASTRPQLVVSNHISWLDIPILGSMRPTEFLAKKEVGAGPLVRALLALQGVALVDRAKRLGIPAVNAQIAGRMRDGAAVILFAEATTSDANRILRFRSSHFEAVRQTLGAGEAIVQPIFIAYSRRAGLPLGRPERPFVAWYGDMRFFDHFWRLLAAGRIDCDIYCGAPIPFFYDSDRKDVARRTEGAVRAMAKERARRSNGAMSAISAGAETS